jgi:hypothetical protein
VRIVQGTDTACNESREECLAHPCQIHRNLSQIKTFVLWQNPRKILRPAGSRDPCSPTHVRLLNLCVMCPCLPKIPVPESQIIQHACTHAQNGTGLIFLVRENNNWLFRSNKARDRPLWRSPICMRRMGKGCHLLASWVISGVVPCRSKTQQPDQRPPRPFTNSELVLCSTAGHQETRVHDYY